MRQYRHLKFHWKPSAVTHPTFDIALAETEADAEFEKRQAQALLLKQAIAAEIE